MRAGARCAGRQREREAWISAEGLYPRKRGGHPGARRGNGWRGAVSPGTGFERWRPQEIGRKAAAAGDAVIVSLIGAVDAFTASTMPTGGPCADTTTSHDQPGETPGAENDIRAGAAHRHASFGLQGDQVIGGHPHAAQAGHWFARAYLQPVN